MNDTSFYSDMAPFIIFSQFNDDRFFCAVPDNWTVVITDIKGSTKAIEEGRYKDVNTIGAAAIVVARKALGGSDFPFVFGGDGATLIVPNEAVENVCRSLSSLKRLASNSYELDLRIGSVPVSLLKNEGKEVLVGKYQVTQGRNMAILKGEGITYAEKLVKSDSGKFEYTEINMEEPDLGGLSCRWNPIPSRKGTILTLLVTSRSGKSLYEDILANLELIIPEGLDDANPVNVDLSTYKSLLKLLKDERKFHLNMFSAKFIFRMLEIIFAVLIFKYKLRPLVFDANKYAQSMRGHSDFRKFDDTLRMVLDCTHNQVEKIKQLLHSKYSNQELFYGLFETDSSLMTCYVDGLGQGQHIHFIDAMDGGYAAAAIQLKQQIKEAKCFQEIFI